ncbi:metal ABC transporter ATP-binding protein [Alsobacter sp. SYSU M60028]|uniref:Metal ABC transporter ATP-binding protein n=1 Tax=Alsobacter ponti TaxID=2962936 RepID=A0ABT1L765_9HYPH|nr:metal ABC transporter ATP-binding protein [Alsobacter ponti]MCP8936911.1 metal ABC transporter ATP-binding protein [Alsobacter ponti]
MTKGPHVSIRNLSVRLGGVQVLAGIDLDAAPGRVHCVVGPNGGGKTTLLRALLGQMPYDGEIAFEGEPGFVTGYAPQSLDLDRSLPLTVNDLMALMGQRRPAFLGRARATAQVQDAALGRLGLAGKGERLFGVLSGGERQRMLFAQALAPMPDLLVMDEPTSNMDEAGARLVESIVRDLRAQGSTILWVNHDWEQVRRVADDVTLLRGRVAARGAPAQVLERVAGEPA